MLQQACRYIPSFQENLSILNWFQLNPIHLCLAPVRKVDGRYYLSFQCHWWAQMVTWFTYCQMSFHNSLTLLDTFLSTSQICCQSIPWMCQNNLKMTPTSPSHSIEWVSHSKELLERLFRKEECQKTGSPAWTMVGLIIIILICWL